MRVDEVDAIARAATSQQCTVTTGFSSRTKPCGIPCNTAGSVDLWYSAGKRTC